MKANFYFFIPLKKKLINKFIILESLEKENNKEKRKKIIKIKIKIK
jgi:hypothetical protein